MGDFKNHERSSLYTIVEICCSLFISLIIVIALFNFRTVSPLYAVTFLIFLTGVIFEGWKAVEVTGSRLKERDDRVVSIVNKFTSVPLRIKKELPATEDRINSGKESFSGKSAPIVTIIGLVLVVVFVVFIFAVIAAFVFGMSGNISYSKVVAVTATQSSALNRIYLTYQGGQDAYLLRQITVTVTDHAGNSQTENIGLSGQTTPLEVGSSVTFYGAYSGNDHVIAIGTFSDDAKQVLLDTYI